LATEVTPEAFLAQIIEPEKGRTAHICWDCKHFKPVLKGSKFPPQDIIGWCKAIHWPDFWTIAENTVVKSCYKFEKSEVAVAKK
jgi:hypothetical protein